MVYSLGSGNGDLNGPTLFFKESPGCPHNGELLEFVTQLFMGKGALGILGNFYILEASSTNPESSFLEGI